jgi:hypothetical protein
VQAMFAPELAAMPVAQRRAVTAAADTLTQFEGTESLRVRLGYTTTQTADIFRRILTALFTVEPPLPKRSRTISRPC